MADESAGHQHEWVVTGGFRECRTCDAEGWIDLPIPDDAPTHSDGGVCTLAHVDEADRAQCSGTYLDGQADG